ncbi:hypothetical protein DIPPA_23653 [Diplonema papillatum]|nr:hypothetical protein DIPPA_23653 [Diplonema papillatum]
MPVPILEKYLEADDKEHALSLSEIESCVQQGKAALKKALEDTANDEDVGPLVFGASCFVLEDECVVDMGVIIMGHKQLLRRDLNGHLVNVTQLDEDVLDDDEKPQLEVYHYTDIGFVGVKTDQMDAGVVFLPFLLHVASWREPLLRAGETQCMDCISSMHDSDAYCVLEFPWGKSEPEFPDTWQELYDAGQLHELIVVKHDEFVSTIRQETEEDLRISDRSARTDASNAQRESEEDTCENTITSEGDNFSFNLADSDRKDEFHTPAPSPPLARPSSKRPPTTGPARIGARTVQKDLWSARVPRTSEFLVDRYGADFAGTVRYAAAVRWIHDGASTEACVVLTPQELLCIGPFPGGGAAREAPAVDVLWRDRIADCTWVVCYEGTEAVRVGKKKSDRLLIFLSVQPGPLHQFLGKLHGLRPIRTTCEKIEALEDSLAKKAIEEISRVCAAERERKVRFDRQADVMTEEDERVVEIINSSGTWADSASERTTPREGSIQWEAPLASFVFPVDDANSPAPSTANDGSLTSSASASSALHPNSRRLSAQDSPRGIQQHHNLPESRMYDISQTSLATTAAMTPGQTLGLPDQSMDGSLLQLGSASLAQGGANTSLLDSSNRSLTQGLSRTIPTGSSPQASPTGPMMLLPTDSATRRSQVNAAQITRGGSYTRSKAAADKDGAFRSPPYAPIGETSLSLDSLTMIPRLNSMGSEEFSDFESMEWTVRKRGQQSLGESNRTSMLESSFDSSPDFTRLPGSFQLPPHVKPGATRMLDNVNIRHAVSSDDDETPSVYSRFDPGSMQSSVHSQERHQMAQGSDAITFPTHEHSKPINVANGAANPQMNRSWHSPDHNLMKTGSDIAHEHVVSPSEICESAPEEDGWASSGMPHASPNSPATNLKFGGSMASVPSWYQPPAQPAEINVLSPTGKETKIMTPTGTLSPGPRNRSGILESSQDDPWGSIPVPVDQPPPEHSPTSPSLNTAGHLENPHAKLHLRTNAVPYPKSSRQLPSLVSPLKPPAHGSFSKAPMSIVDKILANDERHAAKVQQASRTGSSTLAVDDIQAAVEQALNYFDRMCHAVEERVAHEQPTPARDAEDEHAVRREFDAVYGEQAEEAWELYQEHLALEEEHELASWEVERKSASDVALTPQFAASDMGFNSPLGRNRSWSARSNSTFNRREVGEQCDFDRDAKFARVLQNTRTAQTNPGDRPHVLQGSILALKEQLKEEQGRRHVEALEAASHSAIFATRAAELEFTNQQNAHPLFPTESGVLSPRLRVHLRPVGPEITFFREPAMLPETSPTASFALPVRDGGAARGRRKSHGGMDVHGGREGIAMKRRKSEGDADGGLFSTAITGKAPWGRGHGVNGLREFDDDASDERTEGTPPYFKSPSAVSQPSPVHPATRREEEELLASESLPATEPTIHGKPAAVSNPVGVVKEASPELDTRTELLAEAGQTANLAVQLMFQNCIAIQSEHQDQVSDAFADACVSAQHRGLLRSASPQPNPAAAAAVSPPAACSSPPPSPPPGAPGMPPVAEVESTWDAMTSDESLNSDTTPTPKQAGGAQQAVGLSSANLETLRLLVEKRERLESDIEAIRFDRHKQNALRQEQLFLEQQEQYLLRQQHQHQQEVLEEEVEREQFVSSVSYKPPPTPPPSQPVLVHHRSVSPSFDAGSNLSKHGSETVPQKSQNGAPSPTNAKRDMLQKQLHAMRARRREIEQRLITNNIVLDIPARDLVRGFDASHPTHSSP